MRRTPTRVMSRETRDSAYFERREARRVDDARVETRVDARIETRTRASDANFPSTRGILWDASAAGEATTASSGTSAPTTVRLDGDATRALARAIADASTARDGVGAAKGTRGKVARTRGNDEAGRAALIGDNRDSSETVRVSVTTEDDCEHYSSALEDGCVEIAMETLPRDFSGDERSAASALHETAWAREETLREAFYAACESDAPLCPAMYCPTRAVATLVDDSRDGGGDGDAAALRVAFAINVPSCSFELTPIHPPRLATNDASVAAQARAASGDESGATTGFVTLDRARRVVFLSEAARGTEDEPITGVWVQGSKRVDDAATWAACVRFACSERLNKHTQRGKFLCARLFAGSSAPAFYEVSASHSSSPFVPYGVDLIVRPGEPAEARATPIDEGVVPNYYRVRPQEYGAEHYGFVEDGDGEEEDATEEDDGEYDDYEEEYDEEYEEERRQRAAQMEFLQREIDSLREAIVSASFVDGEEEDEDDGDRYQVIRRRNYVDDEDDDDVSATVRRLAEDLSADVRRSRLEVATASDESEDGDARTRALDAPSFDPKALGYVKLPTDEAQAEAYDDALRLVDEDIARLRAPSRLADDGDGALRAEPRAAVARDVEEEDYFPRIKYDVSLERDDDDDDGDDEIIQRYLAEYGDDLLGAASSV